MPFATISRVKKILGEENPELSGKIKITPLDRFQKQTLRTKQDILPIKINGGLTAAEVETIGRVFKTALKKPSNDRNGRRGKIVFGKPGPTNEITAKLVFTTKK